MNIRYHSGVQISACMPRRECSKNCAVLTGVSEKNSWINIAWDPDSYLKICLVVACIKAYNFSQTFMRIHPQHFDNAQSGTQTDSESQASTIMLLPLWRWYRRSLCRFLKEAEDSEQPVTDQILFLCAVKCVEVSEEWRALMGCCYCWWWLVSKSQLHQGVDSYMQGDYPSWKVMEFSQTIVQAWKVMENSQGHGKWWWCPGIFL